jgi:glycosyltransferase involved in cell wall biosynthesis
MLKISVVIITFNEEKNIERCLDSLVDIADEIIVVDSFSTDKTKEICNLKVVKFIEHKFEGHIQQKNWAITQAKFPFILSLDADEALDETLIKSILEVKKTGTKDGYYMNRLTNYCGTWIRHCGWYPDKKLRLFNSIKGKWGGTNPHDKYELFDGNINLHHLKGNILHYSYYSKEEHYEQAEKFSSISAQSYFLKGRRTNFFMIYINPVARFISSYILHRGFLDGRPGYLVCKIQSYEVYLKYKKLLKLKKKNR